MLLVPSRTLKLFEYVLRIDASYAVQRCRTDSCWRSSDHQSRQPTAALPDLLTQVPFVSDFLNLVQLRFQPVDMLLLVSQQPLK